MKLFITILTFVIVPSFAALSQSEIYYTMADDSCSTSVVVNKAKPYHFYTSTEAAAAGKMSKPQIIAPNDSVDVQPKDTTFAPLQIAYILADSTGVRCGVGEFAADDKHPLLGKSYSFFIKKFPTQIDTGQYVNIANWAFDTWGEHSGIEVTRTYSEQAAQFIVDCGAYDGEGGVVEWAHLPAATLAGQMQQKQTWYIDTADIKRFHNYDWSTAQHEVAHLFGGHHLPLEDGFKKPIVYAYVHNGTTPTVSDIAQMNELYGHPPDTATFFACDVDAATAAYVRQFCRRNGTLANCTGKIGTCADVCIDIADAISCIANTYKGLQVSIMRGYDKYAGRHDYHAILPLGAVDVSFATKTKGLVVPISPLFMAGLAKDTALWEKLVNECGIRAIKIRKDYVHLDVYDRKNPNRKTASGVDYYFDCFLKTYIE